MTRLVRALLAACAVLLPSISSSTDAPSSSSSSSSSAALRLHSTPLSSWQFRSLNGSIAVANATTPGTSHTHLLAAGVLPEDPYRRFHERDWQWVATTTWVYETTLPPLPASASAVSVAFQTLDGVAHVSLNGQSLGVAVNAFRPHVFQLPPALLKASSNALQVTFTPPLEYMKQQAAAYPYDVPSTQNYNVWAEPTHRPFLRKAGSDFGWDWGPAYATSGIAGDVVLEWLASDNNSNNSDSGVQLRLVDLNVNYAFAGSNDFSVVRGNVSVDVESVGGVSCVDSVSLQLHFDGETHGQPVVLPLSCNELLVKTEAFLPFEIQHPTLWWPAGSGDPHLYDLQVLASTATPPGASPSPTTATLSHRVGFRRVELIQEPTTAGNVTGGTFFFRINGVDTFMKGANWIPSDSFPTRATPAMRDFLLHSALAANMNMVRVWGGGRYEADAFYETCDSLGLLVWHEFMFACAMYPRDTAFLDDAALEIAFQTRRLRKYTSLAIWGGNNENENSLAWHENDATPFNRDAAVADFTKLFVDTLRPIVLALDQGQQRPFVDTSPSNGLLSTDPYVKRWGKDANDIAYGDVHYYNYTGDCQDWRMYPHARFVSEFGFQSVPSFEALEDVSSPEDWASLQSFWKLLKFRERHENGTREMATQMTRHLHVPFPFLDEAWLETPLTHTAEFALDVRKRVATYTYLTQVQQSLCYTTAIETWRRGRNVMLGGTMGILYWQLNDVWQGTSWSSMEFNGRWKSLQYAVKRAFAPVLLTLSMEEGEELVLYGVSDLKDRDVEVTFVIELIATDSGRVVKTMDHGPHPQTIRRLASEALIRFSIKPLFEETPECDATRCLLRVRCGGDDVPADQRVCEDAFYFFAPFKQLALRHSRVVVDRVTLVQQEPLVVDVQLRSHAFVALFVEVELPRTRGFWDRNSIHLVGNATQTLRFTAAPREPETTPVQWTEETVAEQLQLRWLQQTYETETTVTAQ